MDPYPASDCKRLLDALIADGYFGTHPPPVQLVVSRGYYARFRPDAASSAVSAQWDSAEEAVCKSLELWRRHVGGVPDWQLSGQSIAAIYALTKRALPGFGWVFGGPAQA